MKLSISSSDPNASLSYSIIFMFLQGYVYILQKLCQGLYSSTQNLRKGDITWEKKDQNERVGAWGMTGAQAWDSRLCI